MDDRWIGKHFFSLGSKYSVGFIGALLPPQGTRFLALVLEIVY
jgi:hypothetical protein